MDGKADHRWVSYDDLAAARGISKASAFRMANRHKWEKGKGNNGTVRLLVPLSVLDRRSDARSDGQRAGRDARPDSRSAIRSDGGRIEELKTENAALKARLEAIIAELREAGEARVGAEATAKARLEEIERVRADFARLTAVLEKIEAEKAKTPWKWVQDAWRSWQAR